MGLLHTLRGRIGRPPARRSAARRSRCWPRLEVLEGRCLPSTVTNLNDAGTGSLRQAIFDTPAGGTVDFQPGLAGTVTLTSGELLLNKDLTVAGTGAAVITVSGNHASRVFEITASASVAITGLTIADGMLPLGNSGGGVLNSGMLRLSASTLTGNSVRNAGGGGIDNRGTLTVADSTFSGNTAFVGGGIATSPFSTAMITASTFSGNSGGIGGGGIYSSGTLTLMASTLIANYGLAAGGIENDSSGTMTVTATTINSNEGGGIFNSGRLTLTASTLSANFNTTNGSGGVYNRGTLVMTSSTLSDNSALDQGGGVYNSGTLTLIDSAISGNSTLGNDSFSGTGGGIYNQGALSVTSCTISGNSAFGGPSFREAAGGGVYNTQTGLATITNSTLSGNFARDGGGGVVNTSMLTVRNTIIAENSAATTPDARGILVSQGHNLIGDGTGGSGYTDTDRVGTADQPIDPLLAPLHYNGGATPTMALLPGSPALDAGDPAGAPAFDQRGPGFPRLRGGAVDIGAFEAPESPVTGGFGSFVLPPCDDCSSAAVPLGFTFDFLGRQFSQVWVNNNGNLTFDGPFADYLPAPLAGTGHAILAPFWADVYTEEPGTGRVSYGRGTLDGDPAFGATWEGVASFLPHGLVNTFQVVIADHTARLGYFEVQFNYLTVQWDHPDSSDAAPRAGYSNGAGASEELSGSGTFDALVDTGGNSLRVLRRYTLIIYPGQTGSPAPGDALRVAPAAPAARGELQPVSRAAPAAVRNPVVTDGYFASTYARQDVPIALGLARARRDQGVSPNLDPLPGDEKLAL